MLLDREKFVHKEYLVYTKSCFKRFLGNKVELVNEDYSNDAVGMGSFNLEYRYFPKDYRVRFEYQKNYFDIHIQKENGGDINLCEACQNVLGCVYGKKWSDWGLNKKNIEKAIQKLEILLSSKSDLLYFYIYENDKVYCDENGRLTRLKNPSERKVKLE